MKYIGIDGCKSGWFVVGLGADDNYAFRILNHIQELSDYLVATELVLLDIPIGLRSRHADERLCDKQARVVLKPKRSSSVFPAPSRGALACDSYEDASEINRVCTGRGLTKQTFAIIPKIREVDAFLRGENRHGKIREMHPEVCFWAFNDKKPMKYNKRTLSGYTERMAVLNRYYPSAQKLVERALQSYKRAEVARDDIVDALVGAITARHAKTLLRFPEVPEIDGKGLPMEIVYCVP